MALVDVRLIVVRSGFCVKRKQRVNDFLERAHWFIQGLLSKKRVAGSKVLRMRGGDQERPKGIVCTQLRLEEWIQLCQYNA